MTDTKTTGESAGSAIVGTEVHRGVQNAANVQFTYNQVKTFCSAAPTLTGLVNLASAGSVSAPALSVGNATTGFWSVSTTGFGIAVNGVNKLDYGITNASVLTIAPNVTLSGDLSFGSGAQLTWASNGALRWVAAGNLRLTNSAATDFGLLQFGGTTSSFPALKRSTAALQGKLADDSGFCAVQGKLTTDTNATTGLTAGVLAATTNATLLQYDASGQAYRIPCII